MRENVLKKYQNVSFRHCRLAPAYKQEGSRSMSWFLRVGAIPMGGSQAGGPPSTSSTRSTVHKGQSIEVLQDTDQTKQVVARL